MGDCLYIGSRVDGGWLYSDEATPESPLKEGYAFFAQLEFEDWGGWGF